MSPFWGDVSWDVGVLSGGRDVETYNRRRPAKRFLKDACAVGSSKPS
jgi:hypothetical protein